MTLSQIQSIEAQQLQSSFSLIGTEFCKSKILHILINEDISSLPAPVTA